MGKNGNTIGMLYCKEMGKFYWNKYGACKIEADSKMVLMAILRVLKLDCFTFMFNKSPKGYNHVY